MRQKFTQNTINTYSIKCKAVEARVCRTKNTCVSLGGGGSEDAELHSYNRNMYLFDTTTKHHGALRLAKFNYLKNILRVNLKVGT